MTEEQRDYIKKEAEQLENMLERAWADVLNDPNMMLQRLLDANRQSSRLVNLISNLPAEEDNQNAN